MAAMAKRKEVNGVALLDGWHSDWLAPISVEEWLGHWRSRDRRSAPGESGVGVDMWQAVPSWIHETAIATYSACLALKIQPSAWRREIVVTDPQVVGLSRAVELTAFETAGGE